MENQQYIIAKEMYLQGKSLRAIAQELGIDRKKLSKKLKDDNISVSKKISDEIINQAIEMFNQKISFAKIAETLKVDRQVISRELKKKGYSRTRKKSSTKYDYKALSKDLIKDYSYMSIQRLSEKYNISTNTVQNILHEYNIDTNKQYKGYDCNENIFNVIDTEEKAYWLGFLYADGNVSKEPRHYLELGISYADINHLQKFKQFMNSEAPINTKISTLNNKEYKSCRIIIGNKKITSSLISKGCVPNKSLILKFPTEDIVPTHLQHHFMRGYFDGDGSISIYNNQLIFSVLGTKDFLDKYNEILSTVGVNKTKYQSNGKAFSSQHNGNRQVKCIFDFLYNDAHIFLERKYTKYIAVLG